MTKTPRVLDWKPSTHVEQNSQHRLAALDCFARGSHRVSIKRIQPLNLDQGSEGACTGFGLAHCLAATPKPQTYLMAVDALNFYHQAQREDEWEGESYDGSSVNGAMHAGRTLGHLDSWRWIASQAELLHALSYHGAVEAGSNWYDHMWDTDADGYVHVMGDIVGGHAYCISGYRVSPKGGFDYWIDNSWGPSWGVDGGAWIHELDSAQLWFRNAGEIALPIK